jgi:hypothetical protein
VSDLVVHVVQCSDGCAHQDGCVSIWATRELAEIECARLHAVSPLVDYWPKAMHVHMEAIDRTREHTAEVA